MVVTVVGVIAVPMLIPVVVSPCSWWFRRVRGGVHDGGRTGAIVLLTTGAPHTTLDEIVPSWTPLEVRRDDNDDRM